MSKIWDVYKTDDGRIAVETHEFSKRVNEQLKTLPGPVRFHSATRAWRFPLVWEVCKGVREIATRHGADLKIYPSLAEWAHAEKARQALIPDVHTNELQALPVLEATYPDTHKAISARPFQTVGAKFIATNRSALIADEPGLGKTLQTISAIVESQTTGPILVVGPKAAVGITWPSQIERWAPGERYVIIGESTGNATARAEAVRAAVADCAEDERVWILTSPYFLRIRAEVDSFGKYVYEKGKKKIKMVEYACPGFFEYEWAALVVDESHQTLAGATGNKKKQSAQRQGLGALEVRKGGLRVAMSGTPFRGKHENLWGQLNFLRPDMFRSFWKWCERHFDVYDNGFGVEIGGLKSEEALYAEISSIMIRRLKKDVAPELPPVDPQGEELDGDGPKAIWLPMSGKQAKQYEQMVEHAVADLEGGRVMANGTLPEITRLRQLACGAGKMVDEEVHFSGQSNKLEWTINFLEERGIAGADPTGESKVIITSQFTKLIDMFEIELGKLGVETHVFTGKTSGAKREVIKNTFQGEGGPRVILLNMQSGGTSLDLDAADDVVVLDEPWNKDDEEQVVNRAHRLSRMHQVNLWRLRSLGTIEEGIARNATAASDGIKSVIDGQREDAIRQIMKGRKVA